jgi:hypothetical protein
MDPQQRMLLEVADEAVVSGMSQVQYHHVVADL